MELKKIAYDFSVCKVASLADINMDSEMFFIAKTDEELSLVCPTNHAPLQTLAREDGWKAFRIQGVLDFSLIGILSKISTILAENQIGLFAVSTYNTDYILVKAENYNRALDLLYKAGYIIVQ